MESKFYEKDKLLLFKITDEIDDCSVQKIRRRADYEIERYMPKRVVFDFDSVTFMDSAGIGLIIGRYKFANMLGAKLEVTNLNRKRQKSIWNERNIKTNTNCRKFASILKRRNVAIRNTSKATERIEKEWKKVLIMKWS